MSVYAEPVDTACSPLVTGNQAIPDFSSIFGADQHLIYDVNNNLVAENVLNNVPNSVLIRNLQVEQEKYLPGVQIWNVLAFFEKCLREPNFNYDYTNFFLKSLI